VALARPAAISGGSIERRKTAAVGDIRGAGGGAEKMLAALISYRR